MKTKSILVIILVSLMSSVLSIYTYDSLVKENYKNKTGETENTIQFRLASTGNFSNNGIQGLSDFTFAAEKSVNAVVHVKTSYMQQTTTSLFDFFFGGSYYNPHPTPVTASGSGVIISSDGYIVTNNHVIDGSEYIEVVLNDHRIYEAKVVGTDQRTDIALLKIDADNLPFISYGNSDEIKIGEWVLAVGNPFNLTSTVTAGIVSAKARNINILSNYSIEAFIQFDAAVNPGNSGGALVNTRGELVGINTAIASKNGSFVGYSFAVPVNIVKKIVTDIIEFGEVQRAYLGLTLVDLDSELAARLGIDEKNGLYVKDVAEKGAAAEAGIKEGDILQSLGGFGILTVPELQEQLSKYRPGDKLSVVLKRNGKQKEVLVTLKNVNGDTKIIKSEIIKLYGASLKEISFDDKQKLRLKYGVKITDMEDGLFKNAGIKKGFIITMINRRPVYTAEDVKLILSSIKNGGVLLEGYYPNGISAYYTFSI